MTDRAAPSRVSRRSALVVFAVVTVLALGGVWAGRAADRSRTVSEAPKTAAAQREEGDRAADAGSAGGAAGELPGVRDCGFGEPVPEPKIITLTCANSGTVASDIHWDQYGRDQAEGTGVVQVTGGAGGTARTSFPARFTLLAPRIVDGRPAFTSLEVRYTGMTPVGKQTETYSIA
ncbi:hypothetical protein [Streptomyces orinoci]|uniref:Ig-like domain-containing protein n=1 Tax=Streptomyces orinoci TaxID=67339 RepID=A0ABV3JQY1_STRON|nr:hypothetical protein [Streptomyces orinoci]